MNENYNKAKKLIREGRGDVQTNFTDAMIDLKKGHPNLSHSEIMDLLKSEFDRFLKLHTDRVDLPKLKGATRKDFMPTRIIPYGGKKKSNFKS